MADKHDSFLPLTRGRLAPSSSSLSTSRTANKEDAKLQSRIVSHVAETISATSSFSSSPQARSEANKHRVHTSASTHNVRAQDNQNARLVDAIRNPSRAPHSVEDLIAPEHNQGYCEMFTRPAAENLKTLGRGGNAHVLEMPDASSRVVKRGRGVMALERVPAAEHGKLAPQDILRKVPSWDPKTRRYVCQAEAQTEILLTALLSDLFERGHSPHFVLHERSFVCPDKPTHIILERLGISDPLHDDKNLASLSDLPRLLEIVGMRSSDAPQVMVEVLITALHTLAMMQRAFMMQSLDVRADNILFRIFPPDNSRAVRTPYFRDTSLSPRVVTTLRYTWPSFVPSRASRSGSHSRSRSSSAHSPSFTLPNRGLVAKMADLGMGGAFGVPLADGTSTTTILSVTQDPQSTQAWEAAATNSNSRKENLRKEYSKKEKTDAAVYAAEMERRRQSRQTWGYDEKFIPGYDAHYLIESMYRLLKKWEKEEKFTVSPYHVVYALYSYLGLENKKDPTRRRPALGHTLQKSPLQLLDLLYQIGTGQVNLYTASDPQSSRSLATSSKANAAVKSQLYPYISDTLQNFSSRNIFWNPKVDALIYNSKVPPSSSSSLSASRTSQLDRTCSNSATSTSVLTVALDSVARTPAAHGLSI